jgi:pimeloyl-ACP methyl ester carboxylesterase
MAASVILVHGLWFGPWAMARLARRLRGEGFLVRRFNYASTAGSLQEHAHELLEFSRQVGSAQQSLHFVGHSLGGLVTLRMLGQETGLPPGRVLLLGSPLDGSHVARRSSGIPGAGKLLGSARETLHSGYGQLPTDRDTGMIAGTRALGLGMLLGGAGSPSDGTVSVAETRTTGFKDHLLLPVTHTGLLFSSEVARQSAVFLRSGSFHWPATC